MFYFPPPHLDEGLRQLKHMLVQQKRLSHRRGKLEEALHDTLPAKLPRPAVLRDVGVQVDS